MGYKLNIYAQVLVNSEAKEYIEVLTRFNPVYYSLLAIILIILVIYIINKHVVVPQQISHNLEKERLNRENIRLLALFAELDPAPVIRINQDGMIIYANKASKVMLNSENIVGQRVRDLIPELISVCDMIENKVSKIMYKNIKERDYEVMFRGIPDLRFAQIYFHDITDRVKYEKALKEFSVNLQFSVEEERKRIAKELHDGIGQNLSAARLKISLLSRKSSKAEEKAEISEIAEILYQSLNELKEISYDLRPRILEEIGLVPALISLCNKFSQNSLIKGSYKFDNLINRLTPGQELCLYRVAQEGLNNIGKHSSANEFSMCLIDKGSRIKLIIVDNGKGFDYEGIVKENRYGKKMGLLSMMERVEGLSGKFEIESSKGEGTMVIVEIALKEA